MELSSPPSPPPLPSNGFIEHIHVPHTDNNEPRYCTTIECNNNNSNDNNVSNILISSNSENHCAANESTSVNDRSAYETDAVNDNAVNFGAIDVDDDYNASGRHSDNGHVTHNGLDLDSGNLLVSDNEVVVFNQCSFDNNAPDGGAGSALTVDASPHEECEDNSASMSPNVASHSDEIIEHSVDNTSSAIEIVADIPTPSTTCHESTTKTDSCASANTDEQNFNCDENDADDDYEDGDDADADADEEAIFHFLGKGNEIVRLYTQYEN